MELTLISLSISRENGKPSGHEVNISICSSASCVFDYLCFVVVFVDFFVYVGVSFFLSEYTRLLASSIF